MSPPSYGMEYTRLGLALEFRRDASVTVQQVDQTVLKLLYSQVVKSVSCGTSISSRCHRVTSIRDHMLYLPNLGGVCHQPIGRVDKLQMQRSVY